MDESRWAEVDRRCDRHVDAGLGVAGAGYVSGCCRPFFDNTRVISLSVNDVFAARKPRII
jgi:hypothetical protein